MFDLSPEKIVFLGAIALVVLGPQRLPIFARKAGRIVHQLRQMSGSFQDEVRTALVEPRKALSDAAEEMGLPGITGIPKVPNVRRTITNTLFAPGGTDAEPESVMPASSAPVPAASTPVVASVHLQGLPPAPDDPTLN